MRPIKFRAKPYSGGHYVYGDLLHFKGGWIAIRNPEEMRTSTLYHTTRIIPETIEQFVGYDADGSEIYEQI